MDTDGLLCICCFVIVLFFSGAAQEQQMQLLANFGADTLKL